jgi:shikimate kinase
MREQIMSTPLLVVVNGLHCTGKTTIGKRIAAAERLPLLAKDGIKEIIFETIAALRR